MPFTEGSPVTCVGGADPGHSWVPRQKDQGMSSTTTHAATWMGYGLIAGGAVGSVLMALTGSVMWIVFPPTAGLLIGLVAGSWRDAASTHDQPS